MKAKELRKKVFRPFADESTNATAAATTCDQAGRARATAVLRGAKELDIATVRGFLAGQPRTEAELAVAAGWPLERLWIALGELIDTEEVIGTGELRSRMYRLAHDSSGRLAP